MRLLVTGGCGFIGSNFIMHMLESYPDVQICNLDLLTYTGKHANLKDAEPYSRQRHRFIRGSITDRKVVSSLVSERPGAGMNVAAESHVDRSIMDCSAFVVTNICGTQVLLDACREFGVSRFRSDFHRRGLRLPRRRRRFSPIFSTGAQQPLCRVQSWGGSDGSVLSEDVQKHGCGHNPLF